MLCLLQGFPLVDVAGQSGSQYFQERSSFNAGGGTSQGNIYQQAGSVGQGQPVGETTGALYINYAGFWGGGEPAAFYTLTVEIIGSGMVKDCLDPDDGPPCQGQKIHCPSDCTDEYAPGSSALLKDYADRDWKFLCWKLDPAGPCITEPINIERDITIYAVFDSCPWPADFNYLSPAHEAGNQSLQATLHWEEAVGATAYDIYLGTASPPSNMSTTTAAIYDPPGDFVLDTSYYWRVEARNACNPSTPIVGPEWQFHTTQAPLITSTPPPMVNRTYHYDVEATDADGDALTFSLTNAPEGMRIETVTGQITWTADPTQTGTFEPSVTASDGKGGVSDPQPIPLTVAADMFTTMTVGFLEGVNLRDGDTEQDATVLSLGVGTNMTTVTEIVLPNMANLFSFSALATFHVEYDNSQVKIVPETSVSQIAIEDTATGGAAFEDIQAADVAGLTWTTPANVFATETQTIVFQRTDGTYLKIGHITLNLTAGTITFAYADVTL